MSLIFGALALTSPKRWGYFLLSNVRGHDVKGALFLVGASGRRVGGLSADVFRSATNGRYVSIPRGELAEDHLPKDRKPL